jgi:hypothetical protein
VGRAQGDAHPVLLAHSQNGMGPKAVLMRDFSVPSTTEGRELFILC